MNFTGGMPRWLWALATVVVVGLVVVAALVWGNGSDDITAPPTTTTTTTTAPSTTTESTTPATTTAVTTTTVTRTTVPPGPVPGTVVAVADSSGGSGEVQVDWNAVTGATGYRILRTTAAGAEARVAADFDITTGRTTAAPDVVALWSDEHSYVPNRGPLTRPDQSPWFQYVDYGGPGQRCYRLLAYNAAGDGPLSAVTCGAPIGS